ncbi:hypothetical protein ACSBR1_003414 [Camellia fascicularis]
MSTWQIFSDSGTNFRWEISDQHQPDSPPIPFPSSTPLPSMADLLLPGYSKLMENCEGNFQSPSMFRSGFGKSVTVKQSSMTKALSIIGDGDEGDAFADTGKLSNGTDTRCSLSNSMFQSGSGKKVNVSSTGLVRAKTLLGLEENYAGQLCDGNDTMFQTGLGKKVNISSNGLVRATTLLGLEENYAGKLCDENDTMFQTGSGKKVNISSNGLVRAKTLLGTEENYAGQFFNGNDSRCSLSNSMFQTGSGKKVKVSSNGLVRAKTLLGLDENYYHDTFPGLEDSKNQSTSDEPLCWQNPSHFETREGVTTTYFKNATAPITMFNFETSSLGSDLKRKVTTDLTHSSTKGPPIKFNTAGGRSISVSSDALQRAKSLLGDVDLGTFFDERDLNNPAFSFCKQGGLGDNHSNKENNPFSTFSHPEIAKSKHVSKSFVSPLRSDSHRIQSSVPPENANLGINLIKKFDAEDHATTCKMFDNTLGQQQPPSGRSSSHAVMGNSLANSVNRPSSHAVMGNSLPNGVNSRISPQGSSLGGPLVDITNKIGITHTDSKIITVEKRRLGRSSISPFKRPRSSRFITPLNILSAAPTGLSTSAPEESCRRRRIYTQYPFQVPRIYMKEFFGVPPSHMNTLKQLPDHIRKMNPENAEKCMFCDGSGVECIGAEAFYHMLAQSGAVMQYASIEWVANHYKWIVWKLACYERCYPTKSSGKLLTVSNVLEELKYRYEREVNHGHRSAIKRILEGDQPPSSMLVLCISSIHSNCDSTVDTLPVASNGAENTTATKVELTDGWYSINAILDALLMKKLATGQLFVGQKLRIWGAGLSGWAGPVSPLEASSTVGLLMHMNGTYRAHWADRLGLCKGGGAPLAFRCIKGMGGPVPSTLIGVTRIYPVLYRERLSNGGFIVRSERMEAKMIQLYNQRRSVIAEGIMSEFQRGIKEFHTNNDNDSEEGAKILKILETAAEPEVLMAEMTSEQLTSFATYQEKLEAIRQSDMHKSIEKALEDAGLSAREVTPFMRVRVVGLTSKNYLTKCCPGKGLITIWNPTEKQQLELVEGKAYSVEGLIPLSSDSDTLYLQARGSATKWLPSSATEHFELFFSPRKSVLLSHLGEVPLSSEFDIAALVVYVGEVYTDSHQKKQWVFVTDSSISESHSAEPSNSLLAISFSSSYIDCDSFSPINQNLVGSVVGFRNLIKRAKDQINFLWVAEATENSTYSLNYDHVHCSHLKEAAVSAERWAKISSSTIEKLRRKVLTVVGNDEG